MKAKKNNRILVIGAGIAVVGAAMALSGKRTKIGGDTFDVPPPQPSSPGGYTSSPPLDRNKLLKRGVNGAETRELQLLLGGLDVDGIFGSDTENRLLARKGVKQVTLNQYAAMPDMNQNALPIGTRVMAGTKGAKMYGSRQLANGNYTATEDVERTFIYGEEVGKIKAYNSTKTWYSVYYKNWLGQQRVGFVLASEVIKI